MITYTTFRMLVVEEEYQTEKSKKTEEELTPRKSKQKKLNKKQSIEMKSNRIDRKKNLNRTGTVTDKNEK